MSAGVLAFGVHTLALSAMLPLDDPALGYLASPAFDALMRKSVDAPPATGHGPAACDTRLYLLELQSLETISMEGADHPTHGLWLVKFEQDGCGRFGRHNVFFSAREGREPRFIRLPDGDAPLGFSDFLRVRSAHRP